MPKEFSSAIHHRLDLGPARESLASMATTDALLHLDSALRSLQGLASELHEGRPLSFQEQRQMERTLLHFRTDLRHAGILVEQGLAFCKDWTELLQPPAAYGPSGMLLNELDGTERLAHEFVVEG